MNLARTIRDQASIRPNAPAIIDTVDGCPRILTFEALERISARIVSCLLKAGLKAGDAVLLFHPMSAELYEILVALFRLGIMPVFLDPSAGRAHLERCCALVHPKGLIAGPKVHLLRLISPALRRIPAKFTIGGWIPGMTLILNGEVMEPFEAIQECSPETPALLTFTTGNTGFPKSLVRTQGFLRTQLQVVQQTLGLVPGETDLATLPIFVLANLATGVTSLIPDGDLRRPGSMHIAPILKQIQSWNPSSTVASPALLERLADHCALRGVVLPNFSKIFTGGGPVFPHVVQKLQHIAQNANIITVYGSSEAEPISTLRQEQVLPSDHTRMKQGFGLLAGRPVSGIQVRILVKNKWRGGSTSDARQNTLSSGKYVIGEIVVRGDHVCPEYFNGKDDQRNKCFVEGVAWHRTGDAGYFDKNGRLWLVGRSGAKFEDEKGVVYPFTVECAASYHPAVHRATIQLCEGRRTLVVELKKRGVKDLELDSLKKSLKWAAIQSLSVVKRIPVDKRHNIKIDYHKLSKIFEHRTSLPARTLGLVGTIGKSFSLLRSK